MGARVLQLLDTPYCIDPSEYANAYSPANPDGDYVAAYRLRTLVDPAPAFAPEYVAGVSTEATYGLILEAASGGAPGGLLSDLIAAARRSFAEAALENVGGEPGIWRAVSVEPENWTSPEAIGFRTVTIDPATMRISGLPTDFRRIGMRSVRADWRLQLGGAAQLLAATSTISRIELDLLEVAIRRDWLDLTLLATPGWALGGQKAGYVSSGNIVHNDGILPLIPTTFLVGRATRVSARLSAADRAAIGGGPARVALGPLVLPKAMLLGAEPSEAAASAAALGADALYLIGFASELLPLVPTVNG